MKKKLLYALIVCMVCLAVVIVVIITTKPKNEKQSTHEDVAEDVLIINTPEATETLEQPDVTVNPTDAPISEPASSPVAEPTVQPEITVDENAPIPVEEPKEKSLFGKVIVVDAGHGINNSNKKEAIAPGSSEKKPAFVSGTRGKNQTEEELNLKVALKLKAELEKRGAVVHMTREDHVSEVSNIDRAEFANKLNADISVKIHADGLDSSSAHGVSVLVPGNKYIKDDNIIKESRQAGEKILSCFVQETGANNRGISVRNDMTGFNWSKVPVVLVELGFMTNPKEDALMDTDEYQNKMVSGIVLGLEEHYKNS